jgi:hypothetical protein
MNTLIAVVSLAFGIFVTVSPSRAAKAWGSRNLDQLAPATRVWYFRMYRVWGILLFLAGILLAVEGTRF